ncbi:MAG TPA: hypothetical protein EYP10_04190 [Armatimonadetes bacterium]|nr:hypothetical protein [Armatimonadota bacterium]
MNDKRVNAGCRRNGLSNKMLNRWIALMVTILSCMLLYSCGKHQRRYWRTRDLVGVWKLTERGSLTPPLGNQCEFGEDGTVRVVEDGRVRAGTYRLERNELELVIPGSPTQMWRIVNKPGGKELLLHNRALNTQARYVRISRGAMLTGTLGLILKSIVIIALVFLLYRFLAHVLEFD